MTKLLQEVFNKIEQLNPEIQDAMSKTRWAHASRLLVELEGEENAGTFIPYVTDEEQKEIEQEFGLPSDYEIEELIDMTDWVRYGGKIS